MAEVQQGKTCHHSEERHRNHLSDQILKFSFPLYFPKELQVPRQMAMIYDRSCSHSRCIFQFCMFLESIVIHPDTTLVLPELAASQRCHHRRHHHLDCQRANPNFLSQISLRVQGMPVEASSTCLETILASLLSC